MLGATRGSSGTWVPATQVPDVEWALASGFGLAPAAAVVGILLQLPEPTCPSGFHIKISKIINLNRVCILPYFTP